MFHQRLYILTEPELFSGFIDRREFQIRSILSVEKLRCVELAGLVPKVRMDQIKVMLLFELFFRVTENIQTDRVDVNEFSFPVCPINDVGGIFNQTAVLFLAFTKLLVQGLQIGLLFVHDVKR